MQDRNLWAALLGWGMDEAISWTSDCVRVARNRWKEGREEEAAAPVVDDAAEGKLNDAFRGALMGVLRDYPEAHAAVVRAVAAKVDAGRAEKLNGR